MTRAAILGVLLALVAGTCADAAQLRPGARLTDASVRAFVARQEAAWNARDAVGFAATFTPDAVFVAQAVGSDGKLFPNGRSTLAQATAQARRFFAKSRFRETSQVARVAIAPDGLSAQAFARETTQIETPGRPPRKLCALTEQTLVLVGGRILSRGQTDTDVRCPR